LILVAYRESGLFVNPDPTHRLDFLFVRWDKVLLENAWVERLLAVCSPWLQTYLEICYLLCYPLVPLGLASLYLARRSGVLGGGETERAVNRFRTAVYLALLSCYAIFPLFPLTLPQDFSHDVPGPPVQPVLRKMNFWLLGHYSVNACIFPSGHVAGVTAAGLSVWAYLPRTGVFFLIAAVSVAAATVYGRYHYAADALAGAMVGLAAHFVSKRIHRGSA
jgi:membrane-associated phospholipid phosphatase